MSDSIQSTDTTVPPAVGQGLGVSFAPLQFDPDKFMQFVVDEDLTDEQAQMLLSIVWQWMSGHVDVAFGLNPTQQAVDGLSERRRTRRRESRPVLSSSPSLPNPNDMTVARDHRDAVAREDS